MELVKQLVEESAMESSEAYLVFHEDRNTATLSIFFFFYHSVQTNRREGLKLNAVK